MPAKAPVAPSLDISVDVNATPRIVIAAFFDADRLRHWCGTLRSVTTPRALGPYALEWPPTDTRDELLGHLGGVLRGTVMQYEATRGFFVADLIWLPPDSGPIGPMALDVSCTLCLSADGKPATRVRLTQDGFEDTPRWRRYYDVMRSEWQRALESLKVLLDN